MTPVSHPVRRAAAGYCISAEMAAGVDAIVLPTERDAGVVGCNEAAVRDGDTMRVTGEIAQHLLG